MNEWSIFLAGIGFSCLIGSLIGVSLATSFRRVSGTFAEVALLFGSCALVIGAAWCLCSAIGGGGFIGHACSLLLAPLAYIGIFTGWTVSTFLLGAAVEAGWMSAIGWLVWCLIRTRRMKMDANQHISLSPGSPAQADVRRSIKKMKKILIMAAIACVIGCNRQPSAAPGSVSRHDGQRNDLSKENWALAGPELAEYARLALCPAQVTNAFTVEYIDSGPSVEIGLGRVGCRIVLGEHFYKYLTDPNPSCRRAGPALSVKEYIEFVVFPEHLELPTNCCALIPWSGFTSFYHMQPVDMGTGFGFHWFGRMHLWEQDDLRERLGLIGGDDRLALAVAGGSVKDNGGMTANSMACRMDRFKRNSGSNQASQTIGASGAPQSER